MKITLKHVLVMMLLAPGTLVWGSSEIFSGNGLETDRTTPLDVLIEDVSEDAQKIGLTRDRIEARVNQTLRKAGIAPETPTGSDFGAKVWGTSGGGLLVTVTVLGNCYSIEVFFLRPVYYVRGDKNFTTLARTYARGMTGYAPRGSDYILDSIEEEVEAFANEFLKANGK